jgi:hypothetical protein
MKDEISRIFGKVMANDDFFSSIRSPANLLYKLIVMIFPAVV